MSYVCSIVANILLVSQSFVLCLDGGGALSDERMLIFVNNHIVHIYSHNTIAV